MEPLRDPARRPATPREILLGLGVVAWMAAAGAVALAGARGLGLVLLGLPLVWAVVVVLRMPREDLRRIAGKLAEQRRTPLGRLTRLLELGIWLAIAVGLRRWLSARWAAP
jgi:hypothetical protein